MALKVVPISVITSVIVAAVYIGSLEGILTEIKDSSSYRVVGKEKEKLFIEIGKLGSKFQTDIEKSTTENSLVFGS